MVQHLCRLLTAYLCCLLIITDTNAQKKILAEREYFNKAGMFCGQSFSFYRGIGFYSSSCELHDCDINAFSYTERGDSLYLSSLKISEYPIIRKIIKETDKGGIHVAIYDIKQHPVNVTLLLFKRKRKRDSLIGEYVGFTKEEIKKYGNPKKYYWTIKNVYPLFTNELTLSFPLSAYNNYQIYFNLPRECLLPNDTKSWRTLQGIIKVYSTTSIGFYSSNELCFEAYSEN